MFLYSLNNTTTFCHLPYWWEDDTSIIWIFVFPKRVILKRENVSYYKIISSWHLINLMISWVTEPCHLGSNIDVISGLGFILGSSSDRIFFRSMVCGCYLVQFSCSLTSTVIHLHSKFAVAVLNLRWNMRKNHIKNHYSSYLVMVIRNACLLIS